MAKTPLTIDSKFEVKEEKALNIVVSVLYLIVAGLGLVFAIIEKTWAGVGVVAVVVLIPGIVYWRKSKSEKIFIQVDRTGIYENGILITSWPNYLKAYVIENPVSLDLRPSKFSDMIKDQFYLVIEYIKDDSGKGYRRKIRLTNTQNKSDEEIMEAIHFFSKNY